MITVAKEDDAIVITVDDGLGRLTTSTLKSFLEEWHDFVADADFENMELASNGNGTYIINKSDRYLSSLFDGNEEWEFMLTHLNELAYYIFYKRMAKSNEGGLASVTINQGVARTSSAADILSVVERTKNIRFKTTSGNEYVEFDIIPHRAAKTDFNADEFMRNNVASYRRALTKQFESRLARMRVETEEAKKKFIQVGMVSGAQASATGWKYIQREGRSYMIHEQPIYAVTTVVGGRVFRLPEELCDQFYVKNILVPLEPLLHNVRAQGWHPHRQSSGFNEIADNCNAYNALCIGDLQDKDVTELYKITEMFTQLNPLSMYGNSANTVYDLLGRREQYGLDGASSFFKEKAALFGKYIGYLRTAEPEQPGGPRRPEQQRQLQNGATPRPQPEMVAPADIIGEVFQI